MKRALTSKQYLQQLNLIYFAQVGVMLFFTAVVLALVFSGEIQMQPATSFTWTLTYALVASVIVGFSAAHFLYNLLLSKIDKKLDLKKKMQKYVGVLLVRSACLELPALFAAIVCYIGGNYYLLMIPVFVAVVFYVLRPTANTITEDLELSPAERAMLMDPSAVIAEG